MKNILALAAFICAGVSAQAENGSLFATCETDPGDSKFIYEVYGSVGSEALVRIRRPKETREISATIRLPNWNEFEVQFHLGGLSQSLRFANYKSPSYGVYRYRDFKDATTGIRCELANFQRKGR